MPHPTCSPAARSASRRNANATNVSTTPTANITPDQPDAVRSVCDGVVSDNAFNERIGNTQGIRFSTRPPANASSTAAPSVNTDAGAASEVFPAASSNAGFGPATIEPVTGTLTSIAFAAVLPFAKPADAVTTPASAVKPSLSRCAIGSVNAYVPSAPRSSVWRTDGSI